MIMKTRVLFLLLSAISLNSSSPDHKKHKAFKSYNEYVKQPEKKNQKGNVDIYNYSAERPSKYNFFFMERH